MHDDRAIDLQTARARLSGKRGQDYWRSLEELAGADGFEEMLHREFPRQAAEWNDATGRRQFLQLMGASLALAGLGSDFDAAAETATFPEFTVASARAYLEEVALAVRSVAEGEVEPCFLHARLHSQLGQQDEAERLARAALEQDPTRADIHLFLADLFIRQARLEGGPGRGQLTELGVDEAA